MCKEVCFPPFKKMGCFKDVQNDRAMGDIVDGVTSIKACFDRAVELKKKFFGIQKGNNCHISDEYKKHSKGDHCKPCNEFEGDKKVTDTPLDDDM